MKNQTSQLIWIKQHKNDDTTQKTYTLIKMKNWMNLFKPSNYDCNILILFIK